ncbi:MAG: hypothetical protein IKU15_04915 [Clostridia bacterium]|nr:hypothetical protein [Clostridia bacterium]
MMRIEGLPEKLSGLPKYGARVLCSELPLMLAHKINGIQIYLDNDKYYFAHPEDKNVYVCIGQVGVCDELTITENFAKAISALGYHTDKNKLVPGLVG